MVRERSLETTMRLGCAESPKRLIVDSETMSCSASTMLMTGELPTPLGNRAFETNARNLSPLSWCVLLADLLPPQETIPTLTAVSTAIVAKAFFKLGTPKSIRNKGFDARKRDYNRAKCRKPEVKRLCRALPRGQGQCKNRNDLVFSIKWPLTC